MARAETESGVAFQNGLSSAIMLVVSDFNGAYRDLHSKAIGDDELWLVRRRELLERVKTK